VLILSRDLCYARKSFVISVTYCAHFCTDGFHLFYYFFFKKEKINTFINKKCPFICYIYVIRMYGMYVMYGSICKEMKTCDNHRVI